MRKKFIKFICVFTVIIVTLSCCWLVSASERNDYSYVAIPYQKPTLNGNNAVVELLLRNSAKTEYHAVVIVLDTITETEEFQSLYNITISSTAIKIDSAVTGDTSGILTCFYLNDDGDFEYQKKLYVPTETKDFYFSYVDNDVHSEIIGYNIYGNFGTVETSCLQYEFNIIYGADSVTYNQLEEIINKLDGLGSISGSVDSATNKVIENDNKNTDKITQNQDKNASEIQQNQDKNTDKILNGDEDLDVSEQTGKIDDTVGGIDDATSNAMGGKTDEEVQAEVESSLDPDKIILDYDKSDRLKAFFDDTLDVFGSSYKALLILSLSLGLAAFLIGRRYG